MNARTEVRPSCNILCVVIYGVCSILVATERRRLQLQPRTKPKNDDVTTGNETSTSSSAIFGGAKPVDTATKEKEIAARLEKLNSEKESRSVFDGDRRRFKSNSSEDGKR